MQSILHTAPRPLADDLPEALRTVVEKALEKDPAERYQTMRDLVVDLRRVLRRSSDSQPRVVPAASPAPRARRAWAFGGVVLVAAVVVVGAAAWLRGPAAPEASAVPQVAAAPQAAPVAASNPRVAILPFENLSPDPNNAFFADGLHEEILATLAGRSPDLDVVSRTTMMLYRAAPKPVTVIATELGATHVINGSVRREGDAAVELLERLAVEEPGLPPGAIARQPWYTVPLRDNPRFRALLARLEAQMAATSLQ